MTVHFIDAGPGAADLLTVRATRLLAASPVCLFAGTYVTAEVLAYCPVGAELIDSAGLTLDQIVGHLVRAHRDGHDVARLCSGDPSIYSACTNRPRGWTRPACRGTSRPGCRRTRPPPRCWAGN
ncbi:MAG TPA: SAM-dependent methyltransferase [Nakamurella sp.]|jgi:precorrin-4/cobalt-precorrin-4 C11-methyltransferase